VLGRLGTGSAHAKAILFGEHAVVYGAPAIAMPLHQLGVEAIVRLTPGSEMRLESELFAGSASSAPEELRPVTTAVREALSRTGVRGDEVQVLVRSAIPHGRGLGSSAAVAAAITRAVANLSGVELDDATFHESHLTEGGTTHDERAGAGAERRRA